MCSPRDSTSNKQQQENPFAVRKARKRQSSHPIAKSQRIHKFLLDLANCSQSKRFGGSKKESVCLEQLVFKRHVGLGLKTDAGTEDVGESTTLLGKGIDDRSSGRNERSLKCLLAFGSLKGI